jgi:dihydrofolate reductase
MTPKNLPLKPGHGDQSSQMAARDLFKSLIATGRIDEYHLAIHPVAFGSGCQSPLVLKYRSP